MKVFIPQPIPAQALRDLRSFTDVDVFESTDRVISRAELIVGVGDADVLVALGQIPFDRDVIDAARQCRLIAAMHSRAGFVDIAYARSRGITVTGIETTVSDTTAEFTFALLLAAAWRIPAADRFVRDERWRQNQSTDFLGRRLAGNTLGIIGMGTVGQGVARRAKACGMRILYTKRTRLTVAGEQEFAAEYADIDQLLRESDMVVVTTVLNTSTRNLIDARRLALMKPTAILVNTSRGEVVDEDALADALTEGRLAAAACDVFRFEPPQAARPGPGERLRAAPNVIFTPHIGTAAVETREEMAAQVVANIRAFADGRELSCVLDA